MAFDGEDRRGFGCWAPEVRPLSLDLSVPIDPVYAALDLGTNNCRLLVARPSRQPQRFTVIDSFSRIVRLGEGLEATGRLSEAAIARTIGALRICVSKLRRRNAGRVRCVATAACREAANGTDFVARVAAETGLQLDIIEVEEEARLAACGCSPLLLRDQRRALVFDIGGGSTEVMWVEVPENGPPVFHDCVSVPWGVVRMAERFGGHDVDAAAYRAMVGEVRRHLRPFEERHGIARRIREQGDVQMLGTSGTVTTIAGIHLDLPRYQRDRVDGISMRFAEVAAVTCRLREQGFGARAASPCIGPDRADLVLAGCAILEAICAEWPVGRLRVADRGVREGILFNMITADEAAR